MIINSITLRNFQRHDNTTFDLGPITVIQGASDQGKSSLVRALHWLVFNRPIGADAYRKHGTSKVLVDVALGCSSTPTQKWNSNHSITYNISRSRTEGGLHTYMLSDGSQFEPEEKFQGFGKEVPTPISNVLNLLPLNFCGQHDGSFLLSLSRPEASKYLASLVGLEQMDTAMRTVESKRRSIASTTKYREERIHDIKEELKQTEYVEQMVEDYEDLVRRSEQLVGRKSYTIIFDELITDFKELDEEIEELSYVDDLDGILVELEGNRVGLVFVSRETKALKALIEELDRIEVQREPQEAISSLLLYVSALEQTLQGTLTLREGTNSLKAIVEAVNELDEEQELLVREVLKMEKTLRDKMPEKCPLCGVVTRRRNND